MTKMPVFGSQQASIQYTQRRAVYVVVIADDGRVATVASRQKHFLPGGGCELGETPEATVIREVQEELARGVRLLGCLGEAIQYFYSAIDDRHYRMLATFFVGEFTEEGCGDLPEHELFWLPVERVEQAMFHACHVWAVRLMAQRR